MAIILLIDDDTAFLKAVTEALQRAHRHIVLETATTAEQGLRLLSRRRFDAIISDFQMPGLNAIDLLKECAAAWPETPIIVLTGYGSAALAQDAVNHGAYAVLHKPIDADVIYSVVTRSILRSRILRRSLPSDFTPPEVHRRDLDGQGRRLSNRIQEITTRIRQPLENSETENSETPST